MEARNPKCKVIMETCSIFRVLYIFFNLLRPTHLIFPAALGIIPLTLQMETEAQRDLSDLPKVVWLVGGSTWCRPMVSGHGGHEAAILPPPIANAVGILAFL